MKWGRVFANAIIRRLAVLLVAAALAWIGLGDARAQSCSHSYTLNADVCPDQGSAYAAVWAAANQQVQIYKQANPSDTRTACYNATTATNVTIWIRIGGCGGPNHKLYTRTFPASTACSNRPSGTFASDIAIPTGSSGCANGCEYDVASNGDGTYTRHFSTAGNAMCNVLPNCTTPGWYLNHATSLCQPPQEECAGNEVRSAQTGECEAACPAGQTANASGVCLPSEDDCPAGNIRSPSGECLPGEGQCAAGEARRDNGTCGVDSDGDGEADEDDEDPENDPDEETASGGDSCDAPPSCSGGAIACMQVKIQWRIDCNTRRKVNVTGGSCAAMPVCVGDNCNAMEYAQLIQQWKAACALEGLEIGDGGSGSDEGIMDPVSSDGVLGDDGYDGETARRRFGDGESYDFDTTGYGWGSSCPEPPDVSVFGHTINFDTSVFCDWMSLGGVFVMIMAHLAGLALLWRA